MKIGILTFHCATNYGAVLQVYALKSTLSQMGHDVHVIDFRPNYLTDYYIAWQPRPGLRSLASTEGRKRWHDYLISGSRRSRRNKSFEKFSRKHLALDSRPLSEISAGYDVLLCGSDQIWNPDITDRKLDQVYFGILPGDTHPKRIAYGASAGSNSKLDGLHRDFANDLRQMDAVSVRETNLAELISDLCPEQNVETVVDPTILAGREIFDALAPKRLVEKPYLLYFDLANDASLRSRAKKMARERDLEFIEVTTYHEIVPGQKLFRPASPAEFCSLFKYAEFAVVTSFHGTVFSILFQRPFIAYAYSECSIDRFHSLLNQLGLESRLVMNYDDFDARHDELLKFIDYTAVNESLDKLRSKSLAWLKKALEK